MILGGKIFISLDGEARPFACTKSNAIHVTSETEEVSSPTSSDWKEFLEGRKEWSFTVEGLVGNITDIRNLLMVNRTYSMSIYAYSGDNPVGLISGRAICKTADIKGNKGSLAVGAFAFQGSGELSFTLVTSITLNKSILNIGVGKSSTLVATVLPTNATSKQVEWASSNTQVATVDQSGRVNGVGVGSCVITCSATDGSGVTASCICNVNIQIEVIIVPEGTTEVTAGETVNVLYSVAPNDASNLNLTVTSSDNSVATAEITSNYQLAVHGLSAGICTITLRATDGSGVSASFTVSVSGASPILVTGITLTPSSITMSIGGTALVTPTVTPNDASNKSVVWSSNDTSIATVDQDGNVTGLAAGSCNIICQAVDGSNVSATCGCTITANEPVDVTEEYGNLSWGTFDDNGNVMGSVTNKITAYIPVHEGDIVTYTGRSIYQPVRIVGYSNNSGSNPVILLTEETYNVAGREITIPAGISYIRAQGADVYQSSLIAYKLKIMLTSPYV